MPNTPVLLYHQSVDNIMILLLSKVESHFNMILVVYWRVNHVSIELLLVVVLLLLQFLEQTKTSLLNSLKHNFLIMQREQNLILLLIILPFIIITSNHFQISKLFMDHLWMGLLIILLLEIRLGVKHKELLIMVEKLKLLILIV